MTPPPRITVLGAMITLVLVCSYVQLWLLGYRVPANSSNLRGGVVQPLETTDGNRSAGLRARRKLVVPRPLRPWLYLRQNAAGRMGKPPQADGR